MKGKKGVPLIYENNVKVSVCHGQNLHSFTLKNVRILH